MQLVVAVDFIATPDGMIAAAVAYSADKPEPVFKYKDGRKADRTRPWLTNAQRLPDYLRSAIVDYVKQSAICWIILRTRDADPDALCTKTLARAIERLAHDNKITSREHVRVIAFNRTQFTETQLPSLTTYARSAEYPWFLGAAHILASEAFEEDQHWEEA